MWVLMAVLMTLAILSVSGVPDANQACGVSDVGAGLLVKGKPVAMCMKVGNSMARFFPTVDMMTLIIARNVFTNGVSDLIDIGGTGFQLQVATASPNAVEGDGILLPPLKYIVQLMAEPYVVPMFSAIVVVRAGVATQISWDKSCYNCGALSGVWKCMEGICYVKADQCISYPNTSAVADTSTQLNDCDPKVYLGFVGTDQFNNVLTSAERLPSRFQAYSSSSIFNNLNKAQGGLKDQQTF